LNSEGRIAFVNAVKGQAIADMKQYNILASVTIAQAILESGWGESALTKKANNLFGVKAFSDWSGMRINMVTMEEYDGVKQKTDADFRKYNSWEESMLDHTKFLLKPRYANIIGDKDYKSVCTKLEADGYATSSDYAEQLIDIIERYRLFELDVVEDYKDIGEVLDNMDIKALQGFLNANGFTDYEGKPLEIDGKEGPRTKAAKAKAKEMLSYILK
jgi:flagellum-specific peptidoglycan hydrolase FlgJ